MTMQFRDRPRALSLAVLAAINIPLSVGAAPAGSEFQVNSYTTGLQLRASAAMDADGDFVVTWDSANQDGSGIGIYAQRYNAAGVAQGSEFRVNTTTTDTQFVPAVAMDSAGDFVIVWQTLVGAATDIYAQCYSASGSPNGSEFLVNTYTTSGQQNPSVAMDDAGDFVVVWHSAYQDGDAFGIFGQRFNAACVAQGSEFQVNTQTSSDQAWPSVAMDADGDFVVTWEDRYEAAGTDGSDVFGQRYNSAGVVQGGEFQVNTYTTSVQDETSVAMDTVGNFVVVWRSYQSGGDRMQRFNAAGVPQGVETELPLSFSGLSRHVAMDDSGGFVVVGVNTLPSDQNFGIFGQRYAADGTEVGGLFHVNTYTTAAQNLATVATDADGDFVVAWESNGQDGSSYGIYGQRYVEHPALPDFDGDRRADLLWRNGTDGRNAVWLMDGATRVGGGNLLTVADTNWTVAGTGDLDGDGRADIVWRNTSTGQNAAWLMDGATQVGGGNLLTVADTNWTVAGVGDLDGDGKADIVWRNTSTGQNAVWLMDGTTRAAGGNLLTVADTNWTVAGIGDLDGDGKADLVWRNTSTGQNAVWLMDGIAQVGGGNLLAVADTTWTVAGAGDLDGDGKADLVWRNVADGRNAVWLMDGTTRVGGGNLLTVGDSSWTVAEVGDLTGDGKADLVWRNTSTGADAVWFMSGTMRTGAASLETVADTAWQIAR
jgi:hypothetical protein